MLVIHINVYLCSYVCNLCYDCSGGLWYMVAVMVVAYGVWWWGWCVVVLGGGLWCMVVGVVYDAVKYYNMVAQLYILEVHFGGK